MNFRKKIQEPLNVRFKPLQRVVYQQHNGPKEWGYVSSINNHFVFVKFDRDIGAAYSWNVTAKGCRPCDLHTNPDWEHWKGYLGPLDIWLDQHRAKRRIPWLTESLIRGASMDTKNQRKSAEYVDPQKSIQESTANLQ